ncbi:HTH-type transcriptional regulator CdhR [Streptomyces sp. ADI92-24]|nr:HTH-type transcriptional regulator CdhR [Streptomyces sp. ADI92-24]
MGSICTGSFVLAAAGLLAGRRATTHWKSCDELRTLYPEIGVDPDVLYTDDRGVLTSAGGAAGIDLCLHMIRSDHGADVANTVARRTVVPPHREGGQASAVRTPVHEQEAPGFGAVRLVPVDPAADLDLIHGWVTEERARFWGMGDASREEVWRPTSPWTRSPRTMPFWPCATVFRSPSSVRTNRPPTRWPTATTSGPATSASTSWSVRAPPPNATSRPPCSRCSSATSSATRRTCGSSSSRTPATRRPSRGWSGRASNSSRRSTSRRSVPGRRF